MFLSIKNVPKVSWSSEKPLNLKPNPLSLFFLVCLKDKNYSLHLKNFFINNKSALA